VGGELKVGRAIAIIQEVKSTVNRSLFVVQFYLSQAQASRVGCRPMGIIINRRLRMVEGVIVLTVRGAG
jgi:hypothetical protein